MDIIHLLEVLNPLKNVVTIKIDNDKNAFGAAVDFLIAIAPTLIAVFAIWYSYKQFKISLHNQNEQFKLGLKQQTNALKINTQLATEIELIKDECRVLRETFVSFLESASLIYNSKVEFNQNLDKTEAYAIERRNQSHENIMSISIKLMQNKMLLLSYLNLEDPEEEKFNECINAITNCAFNGDGTGKDLGTLQGEGAHFCFELIKRKRQAILNLAETITG